MNLTVGEVYYVPTVGPEKVKARFVGMNQGVYEFVEVDSGEPLSLDPDYIFQLEEIDDFLNRFGWPACGAVTSSLDSSR